VYPETWEEAKRPSERKTMKDRLGIRLMVVLVLVTIGLSACYKNAGENVEPTSNRVDLSDITTNTATPPRIQNTATPNTGILPTKPSVGSPTATLFTLAPTITPAGATSQSNLEPTPTSGGLAPSFTPMNTAVQPLFTTPGMSDIEPSATITPTLDPALQPTPTSIPVEENPCIHVVASGDTLFSIAEDNGLSVADLVAINPLLAGSEYTTLQIGWQLNLRGGYTATPEVTAAPLSTPVPGGETPMPGGQTTYVVQPGDTVFSIATRFGVTVDAIVEANDLIVQGNVVFITAGQTLIIPPAP
jgi:LysM repeat protein